MSKVNRAKSPLFFPLESLKTRLDKFSNGLDKFSNGLERLETRLEPRSSKFSRIEDRESSFEYRASRACQLTFERYCIHLKHIWVSGIKISNVVTKETSQILLQTLRHLQKPQINLVSFWGDSFKDVGYNIGQVERLLGCINRCHRLFWTGLLLTPMVAT